MAIVQDHHTDGYWCTAWRGGLTTLLGALIDDLVEDAFASLLVSCGQPC